MKKASGVSQVREYIKLSDEIGPWAGDIKKAKLPDAFLVDYVRVYDLVETRAAIRAVKVQVAVLEQAIETYQVVVGSYPAKLDALRTRPADVPADRWDGPYLNNDVPLDPWGNAYHYALPGVHNRDSFDVWSVGPDGKQIGNWK